MKLFKKKIKLRRRTVIMGAVVTVIFGLVLFSVLKPKPLGYDTAVVRYGDVLQEVSVTGKVKAAQNVDLAFQSSGRIALVRVSPGTKISAGDLVMSLDNSDLAASLAQAEANIRSEEARLAELRSGSRPEEIRIQETKVASAEASADKAEDALKGSIEDAYSKADDALRNKADALFLGARTNDPRLHFDIDDDNLDKAIRSGRVSLEATMMKWSSDLVSSSDVILLGDESGDNLDRLKYFLDELSLAVNALTLNSGFSQTTIDGWKASVSSARSSVALAKTALVSAEEVYRTASSNLTLAGQQLSLMLAGPTLDSIAAEEAKVDSVRASAAAIRAQIAKGEIRSPINGIVSRLDGKVGETVLSGSPLISVISDKKFQIEPNIPEADIAKVNIGNEARVTLDAYGSEVPFFAKLVSIDPGETIIEGVTTYKTVFEFSADDEKIKSGMTADLDIATGLRTQVLVVPQRAIANRDGKKIVKVVFGREIEEREVKVGLRGVGGIVEVIEGLSEGETVVTGVAN